MKAVLRLVWTYFTATPLMRGLAILGFACAAAGMVLYLYYPPWTLGNGMRGEALWLQTLLLFAPWLGLILLFFASALLPAIVDVVEHFRATKSTGVARWALCLLLAGLLQFGQLVYLFQLPDFSSLRVVALNLLIAAMCYALLLGVSLLVGTDSGIVQYFELGESLRGGLVRLWTLVMTSGSSVAALFAGRAASRIRARIFPNAPSSTSSPTGSEGGGEGSGDASSNGVVGTTN